MRSVVAGACLVLLCVGQSAAQITLHGTVTDSLSGNELPGANLHLLGTALGSATDVEGDYRITSIPSGTYTLRVSFISYATKDIEITLGDVRNVMLDVELAPSIVERDEVVITAQAEGQAAAINQQLTSKTIVNVISEEKIRELPDANAAEAIGRLPGVSVQRSGGEANRIVLRGLSDRFSTITVDGVRIPATDEATRGVDLSTIPQGSLAGIELYKALTSDQDADAIAGTVNLVTKKAPEQRLLWLEGKGAYGQLDNTWGQYDFGLRYGERFADNRLGVQVSGNIESRNRSREYADLSYDPIFSGSDYRLTDIEANYTDETRRRGGGSVLFDLNTGDGGSLRLNNTYYSTTRDYLESHRNYPTDGEVILYGARDRELQISTYSGSFRGDNFVLGLKSHWGGSFATSRTKTHFDYDVDFTEPSATDSEGNVTAGMRPVPSELNHGPVDEIIDLAVNNFEASYFYTAFRRTLEAKEDEGSAFLDLAKDFRVSNSLAGQFQIGGKYRVKSRFRDQSELFSPYYNEQFPRYVKLADSTVVLKDFGGTSFEDLQMVGDRVLATNFLGEVPESRDMFEDYTLYPLFERDLIEEWWDLNQNGYSDQRGTNPEYELNREAEALLYDLDERIGAGYAMGTFNVGRAITLIAGLRVEAENNDYAARYSPKDLSGFPVPKGAIRDTTASFDETIWLPNFHFTVRPTGFLNIRLAAYKALARPSFDRRLPTYVARKAGTFYPGNSIIAGNTGLQAAEAWNYEANTTIFNNDLGLFSVSAFYKRVEGMYHLMDEVFFDGTSGANILDSLGIEVVNPFQGQGFALTYPYNSSHPTKVWGVEIEHQTNLLFLPGILRGLVLSYNLSFIGSSTYIPGTDIEQILIERPPLPPIPSVRYLFVEREQKLEGQPDFLANVVVGYDMGGFSGRVSLAYQDEYNTTFSPDGRDDRVRDSFTRLDIAIKQRLFMENLYLLLNLHNLTDVREGTSVLNRVEGWHLVNDRETYGRSVSFGARLTF